MSRWRQLRLSFFALGDPWRVQMSPLRYIVKAKHLRRKPKLLLEACTSLLVCTGHEDLEPEQRAAHLVVVHDLWMQNGGYSAYFERPAGLRAEETVAALLEFDAGAQADLLGRAIARRASRRRGEQETTGSIRDDALAGAFAELERDYGAASPSLTELIHRHFSSHRDRYIVVA